MIGGWRRPGMPVLLSGMIGSRQGWIEVPYAGLPASLDDVAGALLQHPDDPSLHLVPGLALDRADQAPDVMRGEETQIFGMIDKRPGRRLLVMPGTHSKWALVHDGRIVWFATFMTGELFAVLKAHSILGRLMAGEAHDQEAFERGLKAARQRPGGPLQRLFSVRTLALFERLPAAGVAAYLSGLLIGGEIDEALGNLPRSARADTVTVIGADTLAERYLHAIEHAGLTGEKAPPDAAARGHYLIAGAAGLLSSPSGVGR